MKRVTIEDVAKFAGVSRQTVSRAINDKGEISQDTKNKVMDAVRELGYRPNRLAQSMVTQRTFTIGLVLGDIANPFFPEVIRGVQDVVQANDYNVFLCNTDDEADIEQQMLHSLAAQGVDGIILFSHQSSEEDLRRFADKYRPLVLINRTFDHPNMSIMMVNNYKGGQLAAEYFVSQNHTEFGVLTNNVFSTSKVRRIQGFVNYLDQHKLTLIDEKIVTATATLAGGYEAAKKLLERYPATSAIYTYNDLMALGAIRACTDLGRRIPDEVAIIGFDDINLAKMVIPALSTVHVNKYELGQKAMTRLLAMMNAPDEAFPTIDLEVDLILRESA